MNNIGEILNSFIQQSKTDNLKWSSYPKEYPPDEPRRRCPDINKAKKNLNYHPIISLEEGLYNHFSWAEKNYKID